MDWKDIAGTVSKAAPLVGTLLGGPVGGAIGGVIALIGNAFGLSSAETTPDRINQLLATDPQAAMKLAELEMANKVELQKLVLEASRIELQEKQAEFADTADARRREREVVQATGKLDINLYMLAWLVVVGFFSLTGLLIFYAVPADSSGVVYMLFGGLTAGFSTVLGYFFGSSRGSLAKSQVIASIKSGQ